MPSSKIYQQMGNIARTLTIEEFLEILHKQIKIIDGAFKQLKLPNQNRIKRLLASWAMDFLRQGAPSLADIATQIRNSLTTVEEAFESGFQSEEFRDDFSRNPVASKKIDAYYERVNEGTERLVRVTLLLPEHHEPPTGEAPSIVAEEISEYGERSASRVRAARDNYIISETSLYVESIPSPTKTWSIISQSPAGKKDGFLTPREFYYLLYHCQAARSEIDQAMTRGYAIDLAIIDDMPAGPKGHLKSFYYAWMGNPRDADRPTYLADQQSKMKAAINKQVANEIIIYEDDHYSLHPSLSLERVHIPALNLP